MCTRFFGNIWLAEGISRIEIGLPDDRSTLTTWSRWSSFKKKDDYNLNSLFSIRCLIGDSNRGIQIERFKCGGSLHAVPDYN